MQREKFAKSVSKVERSPAKFQVRSGCGTAVDYTAEQGCAVGCRSTRAIGSCLLLLRNLMSNSVPLLGQNIFHRLSVEMVLV